MVRRGEVERACPTKQRAVAAVPRALAPELPPEKPQSSSAHPPANIETQRQRQPPTIAVNAHLAAAPQSGYPDRWRADLSRLAPVQESETTTACVYDINKGRLYGTTLASTTAARALRAIIMRESTPISSYLSLPKKRRNSIKQLLSATRFEQDNVHPCSHAVF